MDQQAIVFRQAAEQDQPAIRALMQSGRLDPTGVNWPNFFVAAVGGRIVGAAQIRNHTDGSRELRPLVVASDKRGQGIASRMIDALLANEREPVWMITGEPYAGNYARWDFERIEPSAAPVKVRFNYRMGRLARAVSSFMRRPMGQLVILERLPVERRAGFKDGHRPVPRAPIATPAA